MDWRNKHFRDEIRLNQPREQATRTAMDFVSDILLWRPIRSPGGFDAEGRMAGRAVRARFELDDTPAGGTTIRIDLSVKRFGTFGAPGYMLFEPFGYFQGQVRKWLLAIEDRLDGKPGLSTADAMAHPLRDRIVSNVIMTTLIIICAGCIYGLFSLLLALMTGELYLSGRGDGSAITIHGVWARAVAGGILAVFAGFIFLAWRQTRKRRRPRILGP